jgi:hypothetical protein
LQQLGFDVARFDRSIETAKRLILRNGQIVTWRIIDDSAPIDSAKPWEPSESTPIDNQVSICFLPINLQTQESLNFIDSTLVARGSVMGLMADVSFEPNLKDVVIRGGIEMRIAHIDKLSPNGQDVLYTVVFRV